MGLEAATTINQLVPANPLGTDTRAQGDDHIRLIKQTLQNTFPNVTAPVTVTAAQVNSIASPGVLCFPGMIVMWSGTLATIPSGWQLCNGSGSTSLGVTVPNLSNRFIVASGGDSGATYNTRQTGGAATHGHNIAVAGHVLTAAEMPSHQHGISPLGTNNGFTAGVVAAGGASSFPAGYTDYQGGNQPHNHGASADVQYNIPPYYALAYIIKL